MILRGQAAAQVDHQEVRKSVARRFYAPGRCGGPNCPAAEMVSRPPI
jgi:hypothetical protein